LPASVLLHKSKDNFGYENPLLFHKCSCLFLNIQKKYDFSSMKQFHFMPENGTIDREIKM